MRLSNALRFYRVRLRARLVGECFALAGIAAGVALLFASQVSSQSLQSSVAQLSHGIAGRATLQLMARDPSGFPQSVLARVRAIPGVRVAAPLLETGAEASGPRGSESVELVGADPSLSALGGALVRDVALEPFGGFGALALPTPLAHTIGVGRFGQKVTLRLAGHTAGAPLYTVLTARQVGALDSAPVALAPLFFAQELTGLEGRVSRILVEPAPGMQSPVRVALERVALERVAGGRLSVEPIGYDQTLFAKAATASNQSTQLFAAISALVGFLFAFNAMLLTVPQRRRLVADLRRDGYTPRTVIAVLSLDALVLGVAACALGLALGDELSIHVLHSDPAFLSLAFAIGSQRMVSWQSVAIACGGGMLAALVAVLSPLRDILARDPLAATRPRERLGRARGVGGEGGWLAPAGVGGESGRPAPAGVGGRGGWLALAGVGGEGSRPALAGVGCVGAASVILLVAPDAAIPATVLLVAALLLVLPFVLSIALALVGRLARAITSAVPHVATMELGAARARAVAIAATGALAVFGSVVIEGAHENLLAGLEGATREMNAATDVWVAPAGAYDLLDTTPFAPVEQSKLERVKGVRAVRIYRGGLLDYGSRRVLVIAPPRQATPLLPVGQIVEGDGALASERVRAGGWLVLSKALASEQHLRVGQAIALPTANPSRFRVAALSTNLGWAPGAIMMNASDYARAFADSDASAYSILLAAGVSPSRVAGEIEQALGPDSGLTVQTSTRHTAEQIAVSREALARLTQIATLIVIVAVLALAAAIGAMVWQRRPRLAKLKLEGLPRAALWRTILLESLILLGVGCLTGAIFGLYGQQLADRALADTINFPVAHSLTPLNAIANLGLVSATALAILAIPGWLAAGVPAAVALRD